MRCMTWSFAVPLVFVLGCGDDGPPSSGGSGDGSSGAVDSSMGDIGATSLASSSDGGSTSSSGSSTDSLDDTTTGGRAQPCDACAETERCVLHFQEKLCASCEDLLRLPVAVECVAEPPEACDDSLTRTPGCTLALCGNPYASEYGCECGEQSDFVCGAGMQPHACDYWGDERCNPGQQCLPARDEQQQPLPFTLCMNSVAEPRLVGEACTIEDPLVDPCEAGAWCDEVDPATSTGVCRPLCVGTVDMPSCAEPGESCVPFAEGQPEFGGVCRPA